jgi:hypothetical protein
MNVSTSVDRSTLVDEMTGPSGGSTVTRAELTAINSDGTLQVQAVDGSLFKCEWLDCSQTAGLVLEVGDALMVALPAQGRLGCALGRVGRYRPPVPEARLILEATESLTLRCGEASVDLRANGKLMVKGEDVLLKARGTQRIKAGSVNIN